MPPPLTRRVNSVGVGCADELRYWGVVDAAPYAAQFNHCPVGVDAHIDPMQELSNNACRAGCPQPAADE